MSDPTITEALRQFEATEANIVKLERLCSEIFGLIPSGIQFGSDPKYEDKRRVLQEILAHLPKIDGWKPALSFPDLDEIAHMRFDIKEIMDPTAEIAYERALEEPDRELREYRFHFNKKRRVLILKLLDSLIDDIDNVIRNTRPLVENLDRSNPIPAESLAELRKHFSEVQTLLGSSLPRPRGWDNFSRHLHFGLVVDFDDIADGDWPTVKADLRKGLYSKDDPIPVHVTDLNDLVSQQPTGPIPTKLQWSKLTEEDFERLIYTLIVNEHGYENPEWLTKTRAADRGRDLSVTRVTRDGLAGHLRSRVIIQCKHWQESSVSARDVSELKEQMNLWEPPRVDVLIIATTGRFTSDAVSAIEKQAQSDRALRIEMWAESHLEMLLASRPALIAEFKLR